MEGHKTLSGSKGYHRSVLLREAIDALTPAPDGAGRDAWYLDATAGDGGHSKEIIKRGGKIVGIDVDPQALERVRRRFALEGIDESRYTLIRGNFRDIKKLLLQTDTAKLKFAGAIFDLGVSSLQLETPERGFSFSKVGPLDMRMDPTLKVLALDLLNILSRKELNELFSRLGQEKYSRAISDALVSAREVRGDRVQGKGIRTTTELAKLVERVIGRHGELHPATRVFQALRIAVNDELNALQDGLDQVIDLVEKDGRIVVISFHSLEDRIVKNTFKKWQFDGLGHVLTKKPITPEIWEMRANPRSRSAKMRVFEKL